MVYYKLQYPLYKLGFAAEAKVEETRRMSRIAFIAVSKFNDKYNFKIIYALD